VSSDVSLDQRSRFGASLRPYESLAAQASSGQEPRPFSPPVAGVLQLGWAEGHDANSLTEFHSPWNRLLVGCHNSLLRVRRQIEAQATPRVRIACQVFPDGTFRGFPDWADVHAGIPFPFARRLCAAESWSAFPGLTFLSGKKDAQTVKPRRQLVHASLSLVRHPN
jgi:hypothetical protein